ncbi:hypothetical protein [Methylobacterium radiotolerans]|uniref:hypothetical protein n=1 Tax=Methylobacterium radiotolerans TaxID=31998 RepID=UPI001F24612B|nr:hypothetical protein [Methylobacterium radiotolerans]UIY45256.1 hypothetical protein LZ599_30830 [Methylobacterium radiotolerans]
MIHAHHRESLPDQNRARVFQLDVSGPKKQMLMFPGWNFIINQGALCVHSAVTKGLINRRTQILCVEHAQANVPLIAEQIELLGLTSRTRMHVGELKDLTLKPVERFDFAMFDFGSIPDRATAVWIANVFTEKVVDGADISFGIRCKDDWSELFHTCRFGFETKYRNYAAILAMELAITDQTILDHVLILATLFKDFDFNYHHGLIYQAHNTPMIAVKFTGLKRRDELRDWPSIHDVLAAGQPLWDEQDLRRQKAIERADEKRRSKVAARSNPN